MRKSLQDLDPRMIRKVDDYKGLPEELKPYCYWIADAGYSIMAVPEQFLPEHWADGELWLSECPIPVKYVLEQGWRMYEDYVIVKVPYDKFLGVSVDEKYTEY